MSSTQTIPPDDAWDAWHPETLRRRLEGVSSPWCVVGGWALDLWLGEQTRAHDDIEFTVLRDDLPIFRKALSGLSFFTVHDGALSPLGPAEKPRDCISQIWCLDAETGRWRADMMIEPGTSEIWSYKRHPELTRPRHEATAFSRGGVPYLNPSAVLLFKAKHRRPKDENDFLRAVPHLDGVERTWLKGALIRFHPGHDWLTAL